MLQNKIEIQEKKMLHKKNTNKLAKMIYVFFYFSAALFFRFVCLLLCMNTIYLAYNWTAHIRIFCHIYFLINVFSSAYLMMIIIINIKKCELFCIQPRFQLKIVIILIPFFTLLGLLVCSCNLYGRCGHVGMSFGVIRVVFNFLSFLKCLMEVIDLIFVDWNEILLKDFKN